MSDTTEKSTLLSPGWWTKVKRRLGRSRDRNASPNPTNRSSSAPRATRRDGSPTLDYRAERKNQRRSASVDRGSRRAALANHEGYKSRSPQSASTRRQRGTAPSRVQRREVEVKRASTNKRYSKAAASRVSRRPIKGEKASSSSSSSSYTSTSSDDTAAKGIHVDKSERKKPTRSEHAADDAIDSDSDNSEVIPLDVASVDLWMQDKSGDFFESQRSARLRSVLVKHAGGYAEDEISTDSDSGGELEGGPGAPILTGHTHRRRPGRSQACQQVSPISSAPEKHVGHTHSPSTLRNSGAGANGPSAPVQSSPERSADAGPVDPSALPAAASAGIAHLLRKSSSFAFRVKTTESLEKKLERANSGVDSSIAKSASDPSPAESLPRRVSFNNMKSRRAHLKQRSGRKTQPSPRHAPRNHSAEPQRGILKQRLSSDSLLSATESFSSSVSGCSRSIHNSAPGSRSTSIEFSPLGEPSAASSSKHLRDATGLRPLEVSTGAKSPPISAAGSPAIFEVPIPEEQSTAETNADDWTPKSLKIARDIPSSPIGSTSSSPTTSDEGDVATPHFAAASQAVLRVSIPKAHLITPPEPAASPVDCRLSTACALLERAKRGSGSSSSVGDAGTLHKLGSLPRNGKGVEGVMDMLFDSPEIRSFLVQALQHKVSELHPGKEIDVSDTRLLMQVVGLARWLKMSTKRWDALIQGSALLLSASDPSSKVDDV